MTALGQAHPPEGRPDPVGLAIAREMRDLLCPVQVILLGSRAAGDHRPDSDVDLMAVCHDENIARETDGTIKRLLEGKYEIPVVSVTIITSEEFLRTAPLGQSWAGQATRHGVSPDGEPLKSPSDRKPDREEIREAAVFWLYGAKAHLEGYSSLSEDEKLSMSHMPAFQAQTALERTFKGLLTATNDGVRFRRDAALMWRHMESTNPSPTGKALRRWRPCWPPPQEQTGRAAA